MVGILCTANAEKAYQKPKFESAIAGFEAQDKKAPPPKGAVLFVGSSSIRKWHDTLTEDMAPLTIIKRGFGGSNMHEVLAYADRIVIPYAPRAIVLYEGDNDTAQGISPEKILETLQAFVAKVHAAHPKTRIYVFAVKPSIARLKIWDKAVATNTAFSALCEKNPLLTYVDVATPLLRADGSPRPDVFVSDKLHLNRTGYLIWKDVVREALKPEFDAEKAK